MLIGVINCTNFPFISDSVENVAKVYVDSLDNNRTIIKNQAALASWDYESDITDEHEKINKEMEIKSAAFDKTIANQLKTYQWQNFMDEDLKRKIKKLTDLGDSALSEERFSDLQDEITEMQSNFAKIKICSYKISEQCNLSLEPDITEIFSKSRDPLELEYYWLQWYNLAGTPVKNNFGKYIALKNEAAVLNSEFYSRLFLLIHLCFNYLM